MMPMFLPTPFVELTCTEGLLDLPDRTLRPAPAALSPVASLPRRASPTAKMDPVKHKCHDAGGESKEGVECWKINCEIKLKCLSRLICTSGTSMHVGACMYRGRGYEDDFRTTYDRSRLLAGWQDEILHFRLLTVGSQPLVAGSYRT